MLIATLVSLLFLAAILLSFVRYKHCLGKKVQQPQFVSQKDNYINEEAEDLV